MKDDKDELIQKFFDEGNPDAKNMMGEMADDLDLEAYKILYEALQEKPAQGLSYAFKPNVMRRLELEKKQADDTKFYVLFGVLFFIGLITITSMCFMLKESLAPILNILNGFKGYIFIIIAAILLSYIIDNKLIKRRQQY